MRHEEYPKPVEFIRQKYRLERLVSLVIKWNRKINITGLKDPETIWCELVEDSLAPLALGLLESDVLDAGCGGGFPTLPLAIEAPGMNFVAVDSSRKKINFLRNALRELDILNVQAVRARLELLRDFYGKFKTVLSKAFMPPTEAVPFLLPFVAQDGKLIIYASSSLKIDTKWQTLFEKVEILPYILSDSRIRSLLVCYGPRRG